MRCFSRHIYPKTLFITSLLLALSLPVVSYAITPEALQHFKQGVTFEHIGNLEQAEQEYRVAIGLDPTDSMLFLKLGALVERKQHFTEALQLYKTALDLNPRDTLIHLQIARVYEAQNQPVLALSHYLMITDTPSLNYPYIYLPIARLQTRLNDTSKAMESYQRFLSVYPEHPEAKHEFTALQQGYAPQPIQVIQRPVTPSPNTTTNTMMVHNNKPDLELPPVPTLAESQTYTPQNKDYLSEAQQYEKTGQFSLAIEAYQKLIYENPKANTKYYLHIATIAEKQGNLGELKKALSAYQNYDASNVDIARRLGDLAIVDNNAKTAVSQYERALLNSNDLRQQTDIRKQLGYAQQLRGDYQDAIAAYEAVLKSGDDVVIRKNLALAYQQDGQYEKSATFYRSFIAQEPQNSSLRQDMSKVLLALGQKATDEKNFPAAQNYYTTLKQINPSQTEVADKQMALIQELMAPQRGRIPDEPEWEAQQSPAKPEQVAVSIATEKPSTVTPKHTQDNNSSPYYYPPSSTDINKDTTPTKTTQQPTANELPSSSNQPYGLQKQIPKIKVASASISKPIIPKTTIASTLPDLSAQPRKTAPELGSVEDLNDNISLSTAPINQPVSVKSLVTPNYQKTYKAAQLAFDQKNYQLVIDNITKLHEANMGTIDSFQLLGKAQQANNDTAQAILSYERAVQLAPKNTDILFTLGQLYRQDEQLDKAQAAFERVIETETTPPSAQLLYEIGVIYHLQNRYDDAVKSFQQATQINPKWADGYYGLGVAYEGIKAYKKAISAYGDYLKYTDASQPMYDSIKKHVALLNNYLIMKQQQSASN